MGKIIVCCVLLGLGGGAAAEDSRARARELYQKGSALYDLGKYLEAAKLYEETYALRNEPALLFNIGQAFRLGGDAASALRAYRSFLRRLPDAPVRAEVEQRITELQALIDAQKRAAASPPMGTFTPDGKAPEPTRPESVPVPVEPVVVPVVVRPVEKPVYKRWWLWTTVGVVAAVGIGLGVGLGVGLSGPRDAPAPAGTFSVTF
jgi:tetratricopeptide (TPR) repeat protein